MWLDPMLRELPRRQRRVLQAPSTPQPSPIITPFWNRTIIMSSNTTEIELYGMIMFFCLALFSQYYVCDIHPGCCVATIHSLNCCIWHCMNLSQFIYPFLCSCTFFGFFCHCEQFCYEHFSYVAGAHIFAFLLAM